MTLMELWVCVCGFFRFRKFFVLQFFPHFFVTVVAQFFLHPKIRTFAPCDRKINRGVVQRSTMDVKKSEAKDTKESKAKDIKETKEGKESKDLKVTWAVLGGLIFYS